MSSETQCKDNTCASANVRSCPPMSVFVRIRVKSTSEKLQMPAELRIFTLATVPLQCVRRHSKNKSNPLIPSYMKFTFRSYGKSELAQLYSPQSSPETAMKTLGRWISGCRALSDELRAMGYNRRRHTFLPAEVEAIVRHLGEP